MKKHLIPPWLDLVLLKKVGSGIIINIPNCDKMLDLFFTIKWIMHNKNIPNYDKTLDLVFFTKKWY